MGKIRRFSYVCDVKKLDELRSDEEAKKITIYLVDNRKSRFPFRNRKENRCIDHATVNICIRNGVSKWPSFNFLLPRIDKRFSRTLMARRQVAAYR